MKNMITTILCALCLFACGAPQDATVEFDPTGHYSVDVRFYEGYEGDQALSGTTQAVLAADPSNERHMFLYIGSCAFVFDLIVSEETAMVYSAIPSVCRATGTEYTVDNGHITAFSDGTFLSSFELGNSWVEVDGVR